MGADEYLAGEQPAVHVVGAEEPLKLFAAALLQWCAVVGRDGEHLPPCLRARVAVLDCD